MTSLQQTIEQLSRSARDPNPSSDMTGADRDKLFGIFRAMHLSEVGTIHIIFYGITIHGGNFSLNVQFKKKDNGSSAYVTFSIGVDAERFISLGKYLNKDWYNGPSIIDFMQHNHIMPHWESVYNVKFESKEFWKEAYAYMDELYIEEQSDDFQKFCDK